MRVRTANGFYMPSHFFINIESNENLRKMINGNQQTFIHEYIHFLQDLNLPYCIRTNMTTISNLSCVNMYAIEHKEIIRPFNEWNEDCNIVNKQLEYTWGDFDFIETVDLIDNITKVYFTISSGANVYKYTLKVGLEEYQVGARDFLEYIAHKIENKHWHTNTYDFPYRTVDKLFEYFKLSIIPIEVRLCIIEYCLYNDNPIHFFINQFINQNIIRNNINDFLSYDTCRKFLLNYGWVARGNFSENIFSKRKRRLDDFKSWLNNQYKHKQFSDIRRWVDDVSNYVDKYLSNGFIFTELYRLSEKNLVDKIDSILAEIGIPIIYNNKHQFACMLPEKKKYEPSQFIQFYVMQGFMSYINSTEDACPVMDFCKFNTDFYEKECLTKPLNTIKIKKICPLAVFIRSYGFNEVNIRKLV